MKIKDVEIGATYYTKISGTRVPVIVLAAVEGYRSNQQTRFRVRRVGESAALPKARAASALHPTRRDPPKRIAALAPTLEQALATSDKAKANESSWDSALPGPDYVAPDEGLVPEGEE